MVYLFNDLTLRLRDYTDIYDALLILSNPIF